MRVHITGMSPRMVSQRAREQRTFARTLDTALAAMGHTVHRGPADDGKADLVIAGVASMLSPGATYALVGLERIGRALREQTPLLLLVDDPALAKTKAAALSVTRDPDRLYTDYLMSKRVKSSLELDMPQRLNIWAAVEMLATEQWPTTLVPMHPWGDTLMVAQKLGIFSPVVAIDGSSQIPVSDPLRIQRSPMSMWFVERHYTDRSIVRSRSTWPVIPVDCATMPDPVHVYGSVRGIFQGRVGDVAGWWTPTPQLVAQAATVYLTDDAVEIGTGTPYYLTVDDVEGLTEEQHTSLALGQRHYLQETAWSQSTLFSTLTDVTGSASSS